MNRHESPVGGGWNKVTAWLRLVCVCVAVMGIAGAGLGQSVPPAPAAHEEPVVEPAKSYADCVARINAQATAAERAIGASDGMAAGAAAYTISELGKSLGRLALADKSVARDKVKQANLAGKEIADVAQELHESAEAGKLDVAKQHLAKLKGLIVGLGGGAVAPEKYVCPMHCEAGKEYAAPGVCPICGMRLIALSEAPFEAKVSAAGSVEAGKSTDITIRLLTPAGEPVTTLDTVHEHDLHFMLISEDLSFYAHEHPVRQADGTFVLRGFTFPFGGKFVAYSDFTPAGSGNQISKAEFIVPAGATPAHEPMKLVENYDGVGKDGGYEFRVRCNGEVFFAGQDSFLRYGIDLNGSPVTDLEPLMGAMGHLVIVSADFKHYVHAHPLDLSGAAGDAHAGMDGAGHHHHADGAILDKAREVLYPNGNAADVVFHAVFPEPGMYRAFAQFQHKGKVLTYAVTIDARPNPAGKGGDVPPVPAAPMPEHSHEHTHAQVGGPGAGETASGTTGSPAAGGK